MNSGVYQIMNTQNYHMYIGSTVDFDGRWRDHRRLLNKSIHPNVRLQRAWNKDGEIFFEFSVVEYVDDGPEAWVAREQYYTDLWNPEYAMQKECVTSRLGVKASEETKAKLSARAKGNKHFCGHKHLDEAKAKMRTSKAGEKNPMYGKDPWNKGIKTGATGPRSNEIKRKISATLSETLSDGRMKGENNPMSLSNREKRKNILYGQIYYR